jgi:hypothetical protein
MKGDVKAFLADNKITEEEFELDNGALKLDCRKPEGK